jgi:hypothetical protein
VARNPGGLRGGQGGGAAESRQGQRGQLHKAPAHAAQHVEAAVAVCQPQVGDHHVEGCVLSS